MRRFYDVIVDRDDLGEIAHDAGNQQALRYGVTELLQQGTKRNGKPQGLIARVCSYEPSDYSKKVASVIEQFFPLLD